MKDERIVRFQPGIGMAIGMVFIVVGIFVVMPQAWGIGLVLTILAVVFTCFCTVSAVSYRAPRVRNRIMSRLTGKKTPEQKINLLDQIYREKLISREEYERKKTEIAGEMGNK